MHAAVRTVIASAESFYTVGLGSQTIDKIVLRPKKETVVQISPSFNFTLEFNTEEKVLHVQSNLSAHVTFHDNSTVIDRFVTDHLWIYLYINRLGKASKYIEVNILNTN